MDLITLMLQQEHVQQKVPAPAPTQDSAFAQENFLLSVGVPLLQQAILQVLHPSAALCCPLHQASAAVVQSGLPLMTALAHVWHAC